MSRIAYLILALVLGCHASSPPTSAPPPDADLPFGVRVEGHGPPLILIPGLASSADVWRSTVEHEQARFTCYVIELPGFAGRPALAAGTPFLPTVRAGLAKLIRGRKLDHPVVMGHSLGGFVALDLARSEPALVGKLVIVDSLPFLAAIQNPSATEAAMKAVADRIRAGVLASDAAAFEKEERARIAEMITDPAQQELALGWVRTSDRRAVADALVELLTTDLRDKLGTVTAPALVLEAGNDRADEVRQLYQTQYTGLRGAKLVDAPHAKHFIMFDDAPFLFAQLDAFL